MYQIIANRGSKQFELDCNVSDLDIALTYQIEDIKDITKLKVDYSKTITLPSTKTNNEFFEYFYSVNLELNTFDARVAIPTQIFANGVVVMDGHLQLLNVKQNKVNQLVYEVAVYSKIKNLISSVGDKLLKNLEVLKKYTHQKTKELIKESWNYNVYKQDVLHNGIGYEGEGYVYPYIKHNDLIQSETDTYAYQYVPAIYIKTLIDGMINEAGYSYTSQFLNSKYFKSLIHLYVGAQSLTQEEELLRTTRVAFDGDVQGMTQMFSVFRNGNATDGRTFGATDPTQKSTQLPSPNNHLSLVGFNKNSGSIGGILFTDLLNQQRVTQLTDSNGTWNRTMGVKIERAGYYDARMTGQLLVELSHQHWLGDVRWHSGQIEYSVMIYKNNQFIARQCQTTTSNTTGFCTYDPGDGNNHTVNFAYSEPLNINVANNQPIFCDEGDEIRFLFMIKPSVVFKGGSQAQNVRIGLIADETVNGQPFYFEVKPSPQMPQTLYDQELKDYIDSNVTQKDFLLDIIRMFNLYVMIDPDNPNNLIIEPRDVFYQTKKRIRDWNHKIDLNKQIKQQPNPSLKYKNVKFKYVKDTDTYNQYYTDLTDKEYGEVTIDLTTDFYDNTLDASLKVFASSPSANQIDNGRKSAVHFTKGITEDEIENYKGKTRILFYGGLVDNSTDLYLYDNPSDNEPFMVEKSYPYAGMWDNPIIPIHSLEFQRSERVFYDEDIGYKLPNNYLFDQFWLNTLENINDKDSRLLEGYFILTEDDISTFDFRDRILYDNAYWRVNRIVDYSSDKLTTKVELYKIRDIEGYTSLFGTELGNVNDGSIADNDCPDQIYIVRPVLISRDGNNKYYKSNNGVITFECCQRLGGNWDDGRCYVDERTGIVDIGNDVSTVTPLPNPNPNPNPDDIGGIKDNIFSIVDGGENVVFEVGETPRIIDGGKRVVFDLTMYRNPNRDILNGF